MLFGLIACRCRGIGGREIRANGIDTVFIERQRVSHNYGIKTEFVSMLTTSSHQNIFHVRFNFFFILGHEAVWVLSMIYEAWLLLMRQLNDSIAMFHIFCKNSFTANLEFKFQVKSIFPCATFARQNLPISTSSMIISRKLYAFDPVECSLPTLYTVIVAATADPLVP